MKIKSLLLKLKVFIKTERAFFKNVSFVFGGRLYVAILSLVLTPFIARLFTPEDYGAYGLFNTVVQNISIVGALSLPLAISTTKKSDLNKLFNLSIAVSLSFLVFFSIILFALRGVMDVFFNTTVFGTYWPLILVSFFFTTLLASLTATNIRLQRFKINSKVGIIEGSSVKILNLIGGVLHYAGFGLMLSDVLSKFISLVQLIIKLPKEISLAIPSITSTQKLLAQFKKFPTYIMPSQWVGMLNNQLILIVVAIQFTNAALGQLVMAIGLVGIPLNILANAFQPVITERLASLIGRPETKVFVRNTALLLIAIAILFFGGILLAPSQFFTFVLGAKWEGIKPFIDVLALLSIFLLIDRAFENGFIVLNKQKAIFYFSLGELAFQVITLLIVLKIGFALVQLILLLAIARSIVSVIRVLYFWQNLKSTNLEL